MDLYFTLKLQTIFEIVGTLLICIHFTFKWFKVIKKSAHLYLEQKY